MGACFRFAMSLWLDGGLLPWKTLATNITGSFIIGLVWGLSAVEEWFQSGGGCCWLLFVGLLGSFTTFSAFSLETIQLLEGGRVLLVLSYLFSTLFGCLPAVWLGSRFAQIFFHFPRRNRSNPPPRALNCAHTVCCRR